MANLFIRGFPEELLWRLKQEAFASHQTLKALVIERLGGVAVLPDNDDSLTLETRIARQRLGVKE